MQGAGFIFGLAVSMIEVEDSDYADYSESQSDDEIGDTYFFGKITDFHVNTSIAVHKEEDIVARDLSDKVKVLCWIATQPKNHAKKVCSKSSRLLNI